ncbi:hypothetical protein CLAFUW4_14132 [Fulvia fulva]|nr:hypothetical protein CLAFUR4_14135 [Fulvia fulva]WPV22145.1 hypothetical protein CLAFUW4_14132 [Fulvia fulva]WPV36813.1 hypothetical protein CLAFUW7_14143 [Fulvia fulva]
MADPDWHPCAPDRPVNAFLYFKKEDRIFGSDTTSVSANKKRRVSQSEARTADNDDDDNDSGVDLPTSELDFEAIRAQIEAEVKAKYKIQVLEEQLQKALAAVQEPYTRATVSELEWLPDDLDAFVDKAKAQANATGDLLSRLEKAKWASDELAEEKRKLS